MVGADYQSCKEGLTSSESSKETIITKWRVIPYVHGKGADPEAVPYARTTRNFLTFLNATDIAYHTKIRQDPDFGCMQ
jgi:hypothetical protein